MPLRFESHAVSGPVWLVPSHAPLLIAAWLRNPITSIHSLARDVPISVLGVQTPGRRRGMGVKRGRDGAQRSLSRVASLAVLEKMAPSVRLWD